MQTIPVQDDIDAVVRAQTYHRPRATKTDDYTVLASEGRKIFTADDAGDGVIFTLPDPADIPGDSDDVRMTFQKANASTDIHLQAPAGVSINYGTAAKIYENVTDADGVPALVTIVTDGTDYFVETQIGTWANNNS